MKDNRFILVDKREPVDDFDDYSEGSADDFDSSLFVGGEAGEGRELHRKRAVKGVLYIAS